jgi:hypothetical protein
MSAFLDSLTPGGYGDVGPTSDAASVNDGVGANYFSGALQTLTTLGTGYLSKRIDIDLMQRAYGTQPIPHLGTTQNPIGGYGTVVRTPQGQQVAAVNLSAVMPLFLVGLVAFFLARRGG